MDRVTEEEDQPTQQRHETPPQDGGPTQEASPPQSHGTWQEVEAAEELATPMTTGSWELPTTRETTLSGPGEAQGHEVDGGKEAGEDETSGPSVKTQTGAGEEEDKTEAKPSVKTQAGETEDKTEVKTEANPSVKTPQEAMETETEMDQTHSSQHGTQGHEAAQRSGGTEQPKTGSTSATDPATTRAQGLVASSCGHRTRTVTGGDGTGPKTRDGGHDGVTCQPSGDDRVTCPEPKSRSVTPPKTPPPEGHRNYDASLGKTSSQPLSDAEIAALGGRRNRAASRPPAPKAEPKAAGPKAQPKAADVTAKAKPKSRPRVTEEESRSPAAWESVTSEMMTDLGYSQAAQDAMQRLSVTSHGRVNACLILCLAKLP